MKRLLNFKFLLALGFGIGVVAILSVLGSDMDAEDDNVYGEPDGEISGAETPSFVD